MHLRMPTRMVLPQLLGPLNYNLVSVFRKRWSTPKGCPRLDWAGNFACSRVRQEQYSDSQAFILTTKAKMCTLSRPS